MSKHCSFSMWFVFLLVISIYILECLVVYGSWIYFIKLLGACSSLQAGGLHWMIVWNRFWIWRIYTHSIQSSYLHAFYLCFPVISSMLASRVTSLSWFPQPLLRSQEGLLSKAESLEFRVLHNLAPADVSSLIALSSLDTSYTTSNGALLPFSKGAWIFLLHAFVSAVLTGTDFIFSVCVPCQQSVPKPIFRNNNPKQLLLR